MNDNFLEIKKTIEEILARMDFLGEVEIDQNSPNSIQANIQSTEANWLIGRDAENLSALQQICRVILNKKLGQTLPRLILDVNYYQKNRLDSLVKMAKNLAQEVLETKESRWLPPMSSYERRTVHLALADFSGIKTESEGASGERQVVIKPAIKE